MVSKPTAKSTKATSATSSKAKSPKASPKRSSTKAAIKKPVAAAKASTPIKVVSSEVQQGSIGEIDKRELVERVMSQSDMKKGDARRAVDAVLNAVRGAIAEGKDIAAAPLGKIKIVRKKQTPNGELAVLRVKLKDPNKIPKPSTPTGPVAKIVS